MLNMQVDFSFDTQNAKSTPNGFLFWKLHYILQEPMV
jgi:hypothetical protein